MISRRRILACSALGLSTSALAGCAGSDDEPPEPDSRGSLRDAPYPLLDDSLIDERRPFDAHVLLNDDADDDLFVWEQLWAGMESGLRELLEKGYDLVVFQTRVSLNQDATRGLPFEVAFADDRTIVRILSDRDLDVPAWDGPSSWESETGSTYVIGYDSIPDEAAAAVEIAFAGG